MSEKVNAPFTESPVKDNTVTELKGEVVSIEDALPLKSGKATTANSAKGMPSKDVNPQMHNLVNEAKLKNEKLNNKKIDFESVPVNALPSQADKVRQLFKDHGMDSQQAEKCYDELLKLVTTE